MYSYVTTFICPTLFKTRRVPAVPGFGMCVCVNEA